VPHTQVKPDHRLRMLRPGVLGMWCPGCMTAHELDVHGLNDDGKVIGWDGDHDEPTVAHVVRFPGCEFLLRAGVIHFFKCSHALARQDVPLPHFPLP
jgi:hypothetical protein